MSASSVKRPHLRDLYGEGEEITVKVWSGEEMVEVPVWLRRPNPLDQQDAQRKGRAARARTKLRMSKGDELLALEQEVTALSKEQLVDQLISFSNSEFDSTAQNDVLYNKKVGSDWSEEGEDLHAVTSAYQARWMEIVELNEEREKEEVPVVAPESDEELQRLQGVIDEFEKQVRQQVVDLIEDEKKELLTFKRSDLDKKLVSKNIDVEADLDFYQEYQLAMLFYSCRDPENKTEPYFASPREILEYPQMVRTQLSTAYEAMEMGVENIKNWLSLLSSSDSSE